MPVYNNEKYFPKAVDSVLCQDVEDYELIIIDDGSTDNTACIADEIAKKNERVKVIHQENQWIYASFNRGIREAVGEYIYILNSDDKLRSNALELMNSVVEKYNPDIIFTVVLSHLCDEEQNVVRYNIGNWKIEQLEDKYYSDQEELRNAWPVFFSSNLLGNQANLYRRSMILRHPFRNDVYGADMLFNIDIASEVQSVYVLAAPIYDFFCYNKEDMNASCGKYYEYEHQMINEIYTGFVNLYTEWSIDTKLYQEDLMNWRFRFLTREMRRLDAFNCYLSLEEKMWRILNCFIDDIMCECARRLDRQEEMESRVLSAMQGLLLNEGLASTSSMYFVYELLESLLRYEKTETDFRRIDVAVNHTLNPHHIGKTFANKLQRKNLFD